MDNFEILKCIGEGSFGKAYLCLNKGENREVVIKKVNMSMQTKAVQEASLMEAQILQKLQHNNIIRSYSSFFEGDFLCIEMEYASNGDLSTKIAAQRGSHFSESQIIQWCVQLCSALQHIHSNRILHRDIKSQNVFLDSQNNVKLGDFGIAKCLESTGEFANTVVGSPFYLSPEICKGIPYNTKTDIWSLGCVLYEMCTLTPAFSGNCIGGIVMKILRSVQPPIPGIYSNELSVLIDSMLQKEPGRRPTITQILCQPILRSQMMIPKFTVPPESIPKIPKKKKKPKPEKIAPKEVEKPPIESLLMITPLKKKANDEDLQKIVVLNRPHVDSTLSKKKKVKPNEPVFEPIINSYPKKPKQIKDSYIEEKTIEDELEMRVQFEEIPPDDYQEEMRSLKEYLIHIFGMTVYDKLYQMIKYENSTDQEIIKVAGDEQKTSIVLLQRLVLFEENYS